MGKRLGVIVVLLAVFLLGWLMGHRGERGVEAGPGTPRSEVRAAPVQCFTAGLERTQEYNEFPGTVQSRLTAEISSRIAAHVLKLPVHAGMTVKAGDVLVALDDRDVQARVKQAESGLVSAKAVLAEAETDAKRYEHLASVGAGSKQEMQQARVRFETAQAAVAQAEEAVKEARVSLDYTDIRSPFDGIVVDKHAEPGDLAAPGRPLLTLQKPTELRLEAPVSEACARPIRTDAPVRVRVDSLDLTVDTHVTEIVPAVDPRSRSFLVRADLPTSPTLQPGMFGRFQFRCDERQALTVPGEAVVVRGQLDYVYVVGEGRAHLRLLRLGRAVESGRIEVLSGLDAGETVVLAPPETLRDLDPVQVAEPAAPAAGSPPAATPAGPAAAEARP
jgi:RND family efflux transporter MFP subunit